MEVKVLIILSCAVLSASSENCIFAPSCPDLVTYKSGYICDDNNFPIIKTRLIDGEKRKTVCCKANSCSSQLCLEKTINSAKDSPSCSTNCNSSWFRYFPKSFIAEKAFNAGSFAPGISSFIGRTFKNGKTQIGRFQSVHPIGLFYSIDGQSKFENETIEILSNNNFLWKNSSNGKFEQKAVTVDNLGSYQLPFYIARYTINGQTHVGVVVRVLGLMYYLDSNGIERSTDCYEVLVCDETGQSSNEEAFSTPATVTASPLPFFESLTISSINPEMTTDDKELDTSSKDPNVSFINSISELTTPEETTIGIITQEMTSETTTQESTSGASTTQENTFNASTTSQESTSNASTTYETTNPTTTTRRKFSRTTRSRPTRRTKSTTASSSNSWLFLTNSTAPSTSSLNSENITQASNGFNGCNLSN